MLKNQHTSLVKKWTHELGFDFCGIAKAVPLDEDARRLESWLHQGMHGTMHYMENHFDLRIDPSRLVPGAKSVITATHDLRDLGDIADCCYVLDSGRLVAEGTPEEILRDGELLQRTNLVHAHRHRLASGTTHSHPHTH